MVEKSHKECSMCGTCCRLFLINLNEKEYRSGKYQTVFSDITVFDDFNLAKDCGANILAQQADGSCIYLESNKCSIHETRPFVCRGFFCKGNEKKYEGMRGAVRNTQYKNINQTSEAI